MTDVVAIICGWQREMTFVHCERCGIPMLAQGEAIQWCADCREWAASATRRGRSREARAVLAARSAK